MSKKVSKTHSVESGEFKNSINEVPAANSCFGTRHAQCILLFFLITLAYGMRVILSVGIVAMGDPHASPNPEVPVYEWDDESIILSSFFWGYVIPQVGAGQLAKKYGPKWFISGAMFVNSLFCILIPVMAHLGSYGVMISRIIQGFAQGFLYPSCHTLLAKWVPPLERSRLGTFVYAGGPFGTVLSMPFTGWMSGTHLGWPYAFYIYGAFGLGWVVLWSIFGRDSPAEHPNIDPSERKYIEASLGQTENKISPPTPWIAIATSLPAWAILIAHSGQNWGFSTLLTNIPTYMEGVLHFDIKENGVLSACPYFIFWVLSFVFSGITDFVISHKIASVGIARKVANTIGLVVPAISLLTLGLISNSDEDITTTTLALLFVAVGVNSCCFCGFQVNHMDISPMHAGTLMGITNGGSNVFSIIAPLLIQFIVSDQSDAQQWAIVFYISAFVYVLGNTFFVILHPEKYNLGTIALIRIVLQTKLRQRFRGASIKNPS